MRWEMEEGFREPVLPGESAALLVRALTAVGQTVATAESCTGGLVSAELVSVPGASEVFKNGRADLALAVTGLAGPGGGTPERPVGLVYVSCFYREQTLVLDYRFQGSREKIQRLAAAAALQLGYYCLRRR